MNIDQRYTHTRDLTPVYLTPVPSAEQVNANYEPQFVKLRSGNVATLYLDSQKPYYQFTPNNITISTVVTPTGQQQNLLNSICRLAVSKFNMYWFPHNVNPNNSTYKWILYDTLNPSTTYEFEHTIQTANFTLANLWTLITTTMTADAVSKGYVGNFNVTYHDNDYALLGTTIPDITFAFDEECLLVKNGTSLLGLPVQAAGTSVLSMDVGPSRMLYSTYVDISSPDLCSFTKNPNKNINSINGNTILRQYLDSPNANNTYSTVQKNLSWMNWDSKAPLTSINFRLYDEYGNLFYFSPGISVPQTRAIPSLKWTMEILLEA